MVFFWANLLVLVFGGACDVSGQEKAGRYCAFSRTAFGMLLIRFHTGDGSGGCLSTVKGDWAGKLGCLRAFGRGELNAGNHADNVIFLGLLARRAVKLSKQK